MYQPGVVLRVADVRIADAPRVGARTIRQEVVEARERERAVGVRLLRAVPPAAVDLDAGAQRVLGDREVEILRDA